MHTTQRVHSRTVLRDVLFPWVQRLAVTRMSMCALMRLAGAVVRAFKRRRGARNVIGTRPGESRWGSYDTHGRRVVPLCTITIMVARKGISMGSPILPATSLGIPCSYLAPFNTSRSTVYFFPPAEKERYFCV